MGYSGNYTGYSVNGIDVFWWVLLTAGSIGFPVVVFTVCCLKIHFKTQRRAHELLYQDSLQTKSEKKGYNGPFVGSQDNLEKKKKMPEIIISPYNFDPNQNRIGGGVGGGGGHTPNQNNHVRFKESSEPGLNQLPNVDIDNYTSEPGRNESYNNDSTDLRGLKDAVSFFNNRKKNKAQPVFPISGGLPQLNNSMRYTENPTTQNFDSNNRTPSYTYNNLIEPQADGSPVYSIANSYAQPGVQASIGTPTPLEPKRSIENIYSQVVSSSARNNQANNSDRQRSYQPSYQSSRNQDFDNSQPLYMNTPYNPNYGEDNNQYEPPNPVPPKNFNSWSDSSV